MMLGTDVSGLSTTAANAAAQGLSIVVPVYNEAAAEVKMLISRRDQLLASMPPGE